MKNFMLALLLISLSMQRLIAQGIGLEELLPNVKQVQLLEEKLEQEALSLTAKSHAESTPESLYFDALLSYANGFEQSGNEYEVGFSKEIKLGNTEALELEQAQLANKAYLLTSSKQIIALENNIKNAYHQYCLKHNYLTQLHESVSHFESLYSKKEKAYQYNEIAKVELLQLQMEKNRLQTQFQTLTQEVKNSSQQLLNLSDSSQGSTITCHNLYPIQHLSSLSNSFSISQEAHQKRIESTQKGIQRHSKVLDKVDVSMGYVKELDRDIYTVGVSIPLHFSSKKQEYERVALMYQSSALALQHEQKQQSKMLQSSQLLQKVNRLVETITAYEKNIEHYQNELLPMIKKSYNYAQSSVLEYLVNQQQLITLHKELFEHKQSYYETLFQLYTLNELKEIL
jgi:outer membrane protein TolC